MTGLAKMVGFGLTGEGWIGVGGGAMAERVGFW